jgi:hypothetical protein
MGVERNVFALLVSQLYSELAILNLEMVAGHEEPFGDVRALCMVASLD